jgi:ParB family chromosome partitioning protein
MSRKDTLNSLFRITPVAPPVQSLPETKGFGEAEAPFTLGAPNASEPSRFDASERVRSGAVGAMGTSLRDIAREADEMRARMASAEQVLDIDPGLIDPAPFADRLVIEIDPVLEALTASIRDNGQQVPALVRPHPSKAGRFQAAYGHRRIRACLALGRPVRAVVRSLDDAALAVAQGQENIARRDLSFIEKALFAAGLETAGLPRSVIMQALSTDKGDLSRYIAVARAVPNDLARAIGPAPKAGRARWLALAEAIAASGSGKARQGKLPDRLLSMLEKSAFAAADSDARLAMAMAALTPRRPKASEKRQATREIKDREGRLIGRLLTTQYARGRVETSITLAGEDPSGFAAFIAHQIPDLHRSWKASAADDPAMHDPET